MIEMKKMIRVLIVDDSAVVRKVMTDELSIFNDIEIVGTAVDPYVARDKIVELRPDVITLDLEMPRMDGLSFLAKLMKHFPMPVVVLSSLTPKNSEMAIRALDLGAVDVLCKPGAAYSTKNISHNLVLAIRSAAVAKINHHQVKSDAAYQKVPTSNLLVQTTHKVIAIGASTGGTKAIEAVLANLPATMPGIVIVPANAPISQLLGEIILPIIAISMVMTAHILRMLRTSVIEVMASDYVQMARLKGVPYWQMVFRHVLPNALLPAINVVALTMAWLLGGVVVIEVVFNYPGLGRLMIDAISDRDLPVVQAIALILAPGSRPCRPTHPVRTCARDKVTTGAEAAKPEERKRACRLTPRAVITSERCWPGSFMNRLLLLATPIHENSGLGLA